VAQAREVVRAPAGLVRGQAPVVRARVLVQVPAPGALGRPVVPVRALAEREPARLVVLARALLVVPAAVQEQEPVLGQPEERGPVRDPAAEQRVAPRAEPERDRGPAAASGAREPVVLASAGPPVAVRAREAADRQAV
jgi:hypothetical protein